MTIAECIAAPAGTAVQGLTATCKRVSELREVQTQKNGIKAVLDCVLSDASGEARASIWEPTLAPAELRGAVVVITGGKTRQGQDRDGHPRVELSVPGARLALAADGSAQHTAAPTASPAAAGIAVLKIENVAPHSVMVSMDSKGAARCEVKIYSDDPQAAAERALAVLGYLREQLGGGGGASES
jgi:hypothetical protein